MSMYYFHNHLISQTDNIFDSVFLHIDSVVDGKEQKIRIRIKLKNDSIDFFYYKDDMDHPVNVHHLEHLFSLPLDSNERTDYFLLNAQDYDESFKSITTRCLIYYSSVLPNIKSHKTDNFPRLTTTHELLLCLFDEFNNPESDINKYSPETSLHCRLLLEKSAVYQLIRKKINFYKVFYEWLKSHRSKSIKDDLKAFYNEYLDIILKDSIAKVIPIQKLSSDNWFQNPEQELEYLVLINTEHTIDEDSRKDIQNYFLKKHAVLSALHIGLEKNKNHSNDGSYIKKSNKKTQTKYSILNKWCNVFCSFYNWIIFLQIFTFFNFSMLWFFWLIQKYNYTELLICIGIISFILSLVLLFLGQYIAVKKKNDNLFMPRALVAMALVLYAIVGSEVILKNQLFVNQNTIIGVILIGLSLMTFFIYSECRQHSPYYRIKYIKGKYNYKLGPILIYSFNVAVLLVILSQLIVTHRFIDNSKVIYTNLFSKEFRSLEYIRDQYISYNDKIEKAREQCAFSLFLLQKQDLNVRIEIEDTTNEKGITFLKDRVDNITAISQSLYYLNVLKKKLRITDSLFYTDIKTREQGKFLLLWQSHSNNHIQHNKIFDSDSTKAIVETMTNDLNKFALADSVCTSVIDSLKNKYSSYMYSSGKLESLLTYTKDTKVDSVAKYGFYYKSNKVYVVKPFGKSIRIYPMMLMLQVIIIMLVGLVGQLVISDKTVTEPL